MDLSKLSKDHSLQLYPISKTNEEFTTSPHVDWQPQPIYEQVKGLAREFDLAEELTLQFLDGPFLDAILPDEAKGWFALPTIDAIAQRFFPDSKDQIERYRRSTELALDKISKRSWEFEGLDCKSTPEKFFLPEKTRLALEAIRTHQKGEIIVLPVKFDVEVDLASDDKFPLGSFFTACLGLTHFERYSQTKPESAGKSNVECIGFGPVSCQKCWFEDARVKWKNATGYIPKFRTNPT